MDSTDIFYSENNFLTSARYYVELKIPEKRPKPPYLVTVSNSITENNYSD